MTSEAATTPVGFEQARAIADAVLYEGYVLYPYRRSSQKNQVRWQFGVLAPKPWLMSQGPLDETSVAGSVESWFQQTEILLEAPSGATVTVRLRFLQVQARVVERRTDSGYAAVDVLDVGGERHLTFDEAVPVEYDVRATLADLVSGERRFPVAAPGADAWEDLPNGAGRVARHREPVTGVVTLSAYPVEAPFPVVKVRARVANTANTGDGEAPAPPRPEALRRSMVATHLLLSTDRGEFLSILEPPHWAGPAAATCSNVHTFPVLVGRDPSDRIVLSSPVILYDGVQVAPESPGDLHDGGEIDEILSLRTLTLTDEEKAEARATDARTAAIVDRVDAMPPELLEKLHGAVRSIRPVARAEPSVVVGGRHVGQGSRVRLRPRRHGTDAQDMFLAGRTATVSDVLFDVDGSRFVAVTLDDDPAGDLLAWYGRSYHFAPDEIEVLP